MSAFSSSRCRAVLAEVLHYGRPGWWRGDIEEVMIGALLAQQTRWENVEKGLARMKELGIGTLGGVAGCDGEILEKAVRCTGFYRVKARRLRALAQYVARRPQGLEGMQMEDTARLMEELRSIEGIGEETAESILCYAFERTVFVMDAYTQQICRCAGIPGTRNSLRDLIVQELPATPESYRAAHAAFVEFGRQFCRRRRCSGCGIQRLTE
jgi:endonuclease-3 related protein